MKTTYYPQGVCSQEMEVEVENGKVKSVAILGGCNGNLKGISNLVAGMPVEEVIHRLRGIKCGRRSTSCPDQLSIALEQAVSNK